MDMTEAFSRTYTSLKDKFIEKRYFEVPLTESKGHIEQKTVWKHLENTVNTYSKLERAHAKSSIEANKI